MYNAICTSTLQTKVRRPSLEEFQASWHSNSSNDDAKSSILLEVALGEHSTGEVSPAARQVVMIVRGYYTCVHCSVLLNRNGYRGSTFSQIMHVACTLPASSRRKGVILSFLRICPASYLQTCGNDKCNNFSAWNAQTCVLICMLVCVDRGIGVLQALCDVRIDAVQVSWLQEEDPTELPQGTPAARLHEVCQMHAGAFPRSWHYAYQTLLEVQSGAQCLEPNVLTHVCTHAFAISIHMQSRESAEEISELKAKNRFRTFCTFVCRHARTHVYVHFCFMLQGTSCEA